MLEFFRVSFLVVVLSARKFWVGTAGTRGNFVAKIFSKLVFRTLPLLKYGHFWGVSLRSCHPCARQTSGSSSTILHRHHAIVDIDDDQRIYDFAHRDVESDLRQLRAFAHVRAPYLFAKISSSIAIVDPDLQRCDRLVRQTGSTLQGPKHTFHSLGDPP
ncbi:hypothetical protein V1506DRAFT_256864 [Lipomyces tetrasporus]